MKLEEILKKIKSEKEIRIVKNENNPLYLAYSRLYEKPKGRLMFETELLKDMAKNIFNYLKENVFKNYEKIIALDVGHGGNSIIAQTMPEQYEANTLDIIYGVSDIYQWTNAPRKVNDYTYIGDFFKLNDSDSELKNKKIDLYVFWGSFIEDQFHYFTPSAINWPFKGLIRQLENVVLENNPNAKLLVISSRFAYYIEEFDAKKDQEALIELLKESRFKNVELFLDEESRYKEIDGMLLYNEENIKNH